MPIPMQMPPMPDEGRPIPEYLNLRCTRCGYDLTGLVSRTCPECGTDFDPLETWQANVRGTWEFHFAYMRPLWQYIVLGVIIAPVPVGFIAIGLLSTFRIYISTPFWFTVALLGATYHFFAHYYDWSGPLRWILFAYLLLLATAPAVFLV
jgi:hypothetical protein